MARNNQNRNNNRNNNRNDNQNNNQSSNHNNNNSNQNNNQNRNNKQKNNRKNNNNNNNNNQNKANGKPCLNCYKPGHFQNECTAECGNCGLRGHTRNHCPRPSKKHESAKPYCIDCNQSNHSTEACTRCKYCDSSTHQTSACTKEYKKRNWEDGAVKCGNCEVIGHAAGSCRNPNSNRGWEKDEDGNPVAPDYLPPNFHKQPLPAAQPLFFNPQAIAPHCERCESHGVPAILSFHDHKTCQNLRYCRFCNLTTHNDDQCINAAAQDSYKRAAGAPCARCNSMGHNFAECLHWNPGEDLTILHVHNESILALDGWVLNYKLELWGFKKPRDDIYTSMVNNVCIGLHYLYVPAIVELSKKGFTLRCRRCATKATLHDSMSEGTVMGSCEADVISVAPQKNDEAILRIDCDCFLAEGMVWNRIAPPQMARLDKYANPWHGN